MEVPSALTRAGTALVNALMYRPFAHLQLRGSPDRDPKMRVGCLRIAVPYPGCPLERLEELIEYLGRALQKLPARIAEALRPIQALWGSESYRRELVETGRPLEELYEKARSSGLPFARAMEEGGSERLRRQAQVVWEQTEFFRREEILLQSVLAPLDCEWERQVTGIVDAMNRFVEVLHAMPWKLLTSH